MKKPISNYAIFGIKILQEHYFFEVLLQHPTRLILFGRNPNHIRETSRYFRTILPQQLRDVAREKPD